MKYLALLSLFSLVIADASKDGLPILFGSNVGACPAPEANDCLDLINTLNLKNDTRYQISENTYTTVATQGTCSLAMWRAESRTENQLWLTSDKMARGVHAMMGYAAGGGVSSGVLAASYPSGYRGLPLYWSLLSDPSKMADCAAATRLYTELPSAQPVNLSRRRAGKRAVRDNQGKERKNRSDDQYTNSQSYAQPDSQSYGQPDSQSYSQPDDSNGQSYGQPDDSKSQSYGQPDSQDYGQPGYLSYHIE